MQVAEQYLLMPGHAARLAVINDGMIGKATSVQISSTHLDHAVSMIRGLLGVGLQDHLISLAIEESAAMGREVKTTTEAWAG